jgi:N-acetylglucosaminyl-diphospho-decaprenol L-rhamnosyltransferase
MRGESLVTQLEKTSQTRPTVAPDAGVFVSDFDVVILNYNTASLLRDCLKSVLASECNFTWRVWVVDNGSKDDSAGMVRREFLPYHDNLTLIENNDNRGFAHGNNLALRQICPLDNPNPLHIGATPTARYMLLLNPDTVVPPDCFQIAYDFMQTHPDAGAMGVKLVRGNGQLDLACRRSFPTPQVSLYRMLGLSKFFPKNRRFARYNLTYLSQDETYEVDSVCGAFMLVRADAIRQAGILDEAYFMYGEDLDWAFRIKAAGWKVFYHPATTVIHYKGESSKQRSTGAILNFYDAMRIFYGKHYAPHTFFGLNWVIYGGIYAKQTLALARNALRPKDKKRVS